MAAKTGAALLALTLLLPGAASAQAVAAPEGRARKGEVEAMERKGPAPERRRAPLQLEAVSITGSPEQPAILFFLPKAKFRLLPVRTGRDWKERVATDTRETGDPTR